MEGRGKLGHRVSNRKPRRWSKLVPMIQKEVNIRFKLRKLVSDVPQKKRIISEQGARSILKMEKARLGCVTFRLSHWLNTYNWRPWVEFIA